MSDQNQITVFPDLAAEAPINPERRGSWSIGDSAMHKYAPVCTRVLEVACAAELEEAARTLIAL